MIADVLRARGFKGKLMAHVMPWFTKILGSNYHPMHDYNSNDPATISRQLDVMQKHGIDGVIMTYQGPLALFQHGTTVEFSKQCVKRAMCFGLLLDPWAARLGHGSKEVNIQAALVHPEVQAMLTSPAYLPERAILDFNTGVDFGKVPFAVGRPIWGLGTGFAWSHDAGDVDPIVSLKGAYAKHPIKVGSLCMSFFDGGMPVGTALDFNKQNWGGGSATRYTPDRAGNYFFDQLDATPMTLPYIALETWNDYNERTAWEPWLSALAGIRIS